MWCCFSADEELGYVYVPLSAPTAAYYGGHRPGENLFANSLVALDARSGVRIWHFQTVHHDLWDYDLTAAPKLLTVRHDGRPVDIVAQPSKQGYLYVFQRDTGEPLWPIVDMPVPASDVPGEVASPTQPVPTVPPPFARLEDQIGWYDRRSSYNQGMFKWLKVTQVASAALVPVVAGLGVPLVEAQRALPRADVPGAQV
jgi:glucose dehydrogenase